MSGKIILDWQLFLEELVGEKPIADIQSYINGMGMSFNDKLFFTNNINFDIIVDFGCADGSFLSRVSKINPNVKIVGYDLDQNMISKAKSILGKNAIVT
jgi:tRNA G46 methylase TrmB